MWRRRTRETRLGPVCDFGSFGRKERSARGGGVVMSRGTGWIWCRDADPLPRLRLPRVGLKKKQSR